MKIKCIHVQWEDVPQEVFRSNNVTNKGVDFFLKQNAEYVVYGITLRNTCFWYYVCDEYFTYFPRWKPSPFFEVIDQRLSRHWICTYKKHKNYTQAFPIITFPEWANNHPDFYDKLSNGNENEVNIFKSYKELMDLEFPDRGIKILAKIADTEWLICPSCTDAWEHSESRDALVRCPKCLLVYKNPRYRDEWPGVSVMRGK